MHVAHISFYIDPVGRRPEQLLHDWPSLVDVAEAAANAGGTRVSVIQAATQSAVIEQNAITYHFLEPENGHATIALSSTFRDLLRRLRVDVLHVHGFGFPADLLKLAALSPHTPILVQDHANRVPRLWHRPLWRRGLAVAAGVAFCARDQAVPFINAGLLRSNVKIFAIPESTSRFGPGDRNDARERTGIYGDPALLWVGHLDSNKDPLSALRGVSIAARELPNLQLWYCFASAPLLKAVQRLINGDHWLTERVHLLGRKPHAEIEYLMRAADFFVLGSHREGSGYSVIEAMACGLPSLVTDIPSFRTLTDCKESLWRCGDSDGLARALIVAAVGASQRTRKSVRDHFEREISFVAIGRKLRRAYAELLHAHVEYAHPAL